MLKVLRDEIQEMRSRLLQLQHIQLAQREADAHPSTLLQPVADFDDSSIAHTPPAEEADGHLGNFDSAHTCVVQPQRATSATTPTTYDWMPPTRTAPEEANEVAYL